MLNRHGSYLETRKNGFQLFTTCKSVMGNIHMHTTQEKKNSNKGNNNSWVYHVPCPILITGYLLAHLIFTTILRGRDYYHQHLGMEESEAESLYPKQHGVEESETRCEHGSVNSKACFS